MCKCGKKKCLDMDAQSFHVLIISFFIAIFRFYPDANGNENTATVCSGEKTTSGMLKIQEGASLLQNKTSVCKIVFDATEAAWPQNRSRLTLAHIKDSSGNLPAVPQGFGDGSQLGLRCRLVATSVPNVMKRPHIWWPHSVFFLLAGFLFLPLSVQRLPNWLKNSQIKRPRTSGPLLESVGAGRECLYWAFSQRQTLHNLARGRRKKQNLQISFYSIFAWPVIVSSTLISKYW